MKSLTKKSSQGSIFRRKSKASTEAASPHSSTRSLFRFNKVKEINDADNKGEGESDYDIVNKPDEPSTPITESTTPIVESISDDHLQLSEPWIPSKFVNIGTLLKKDQYFGHTQVLHKLCIEADCKLRPWTDIIDFISALGSKRDILEGMVSKQDGNYNWTALHIAANSAPAEAIMDILSLDPLSATAADDNEWLPLHFAIFGGNIDGARCLVDAHPNSIAAEDVDGETPLEKCKNEVMLREVLWCHPQSAIKVGFVMRSNPTAFISIIPESEGWTVSDLNKYFRSKPLATFPSSPKQSIKLSLSDGNMSTLTDHSDVPENDSTPIPMTVSDNNKTHIGCNSSEFKNDSSDVNNFIHSRDEAISAMQRNEHLMTILKRESNLKLEAKDDEIDRLKLHQKNLMKDLTRAREEVQHKEDAMESVRMELAREIYQKSLQANDIHKDYETAVKELAAARIDLSKLEELKANEVETVRLQNRQSLAELAQLKGQLDESNLTIATLKSENESSRKIVTDLKTVHESKISELSTTVSELEGERDTLLKKSETVHKELEDMSLERKRYCEELERMKVISEEKLTTLRLEFLKSTEQKDNKIAHLEEDLKESNNEIKAHLDRHSNILVDHEKVLAQKLLLENQYDRLNETLTTERRKLEIENEKLRKEVDEKSDTINCLNLKMIKESESNDRIVTHLKKTLFESQEEAHRTNAQLKQIGTDLSSANSDTAKNNLEIIKLKAEIESLKRSLSVANSTLEQKLDTISRLEESAKVNEVTNQSLAEKLKDKENDLRKSHQLVIEKEQTIKKLKKNMQLMEQDIDEAGRRLESLELQNDALEKQSRSFWSSLACG